MEKHTNLRLFVYGTLRKGLNANDEFLRCHIINQEIGYVKGELYTLRNRIFPALIYGERFIRGEVFTLDKNFDFTEMDEYESCFGEGCKDNLYNREVMEIYDSNGKHKCDAMVYVYNLNRINSKLELENLIESNDYFKIDCDEV